MSNKVALITGGSRGIGLGISESLASAGYRIAVNGVRPEQQLADTIEKLNSLGTEVIYCQGNIAKAEDRKRILEKIDHRFGQLNILVNNAGVAPKQRKDILEATEESYDWVMDINLKGPYFLTQAAANWMIAQQQKEANFSGAIINVSSISATVISTSRGEYCVSKAGMSMMTGLYASRLGEFNIPVYEIRPGIIKTDMTAAVQEKYDRLFEEGLAVDKRWGLPEDVAKAVLALAEGSFPYSTGQVIMVDGGLCLPRL